MRAKDIRFLANALPIIIVFRYADTTIFM